LTGLRQIISAFVAIGRAPGSPTVLEAKPICGLFQHWLIALWTFDAGAIQAKDNQVREDDNDWEANRNEHCHRDEGKMNQKENGRNDVKSSRNA
jgi:hypothetical protein